MGLLCQSGLIILAIAVAAVAGLPNHSGIEGKNVRMLHPVKSIQDQDGAVEREQLVPKERSDSLLSERRNSLTGARDDSMDVVQSKISSKVGTKITGGQPAIPGSYPYQVSIQVLDLFGSSHICGGAIISEMFVLTVAQCVTSQLVSNLQVVAGDYTLSDTTGYEQVRQVDSITVHPSYVTEQPQKNDIAIIKVPVPFVYDNMVGNIPLALDDVIIEEECITTGWGSTSDSGPYSDVLMEVGVMVLEGSQCTEVYGDEYSSDSMLCAGDLVDGKDFCQGDEGGPLNCASSLQGLASWGVGCGRGNPGVYTRVHNFTEWIEDVILGV